MRYALAFLVFAASTVYAADPTFTIDPDSLTPVNGYVTFVPKGDIKGVTYRGLSGVHPMPAHLFANKLQFALPVERLPAGKYQFEAIGSLNDVHVSRKFVITVGEGGDDKKFTPFPDDDKKKVIPDDDKKEVTYDPPLWIIIVEETSTRTASTARVIGNTPYWDDLEKRGYLMRPYDVSTPDAKIRGFDKVSPLPAMMVYTKEGIKVWDKWKELPALNSSITGMLPKVK